jgi:predicted oxidoreductase
MIKEVNIGGQMRPVSFAFSTIAEFCDITGRTLTEATNVVNNIKAGEVKTLIWCALKMGAKFAGREQVPTVDEVERWIDEDITVVSQTMGIFADSMVHDKKKGKAPGKK